MSKGSISKKEKSDALKRHKERKMTKNKKSFTSEYTNRSDYSFVHFYLEVFREKVGRQNIMNRMIVSIPSI
jgi:hypothetical protein